MGNGYTPTAGDVLEAWAAHQAHDQPTALDLVDAYDSFNRWLATEKAKWQAEALRGAQDELVRRDAFTERSLRILDELIEKEEQS